MSDLESQIFQMSTEIPAKDLLQSDEFRRYAASVRREHVNKTNEEILAELINCHSERLRKE